MSALVLTPCDFNKQMTSLAPFEASPIVAVGVSGGADSMALMLSMDQWARERGGQAIGLTVDHGLRAESAKEASRVADWLGRLNIEHHILHWHGEKPVTGIQAAARMARRNLMTAWCQHAGVLHLALAHHQDDQAETYLMRLAHASGPDGLAGMASVVETTHVRLIRPFLDVPKLRLEATLKQRKQRWIIDPSNSQEKFERIRVRKALAGMDDAGVSAKAITAAMRDHADQRNEMERLTADALAQSLQVFDAGYAMLAAGSLVKFGATLGCRALARTLGMVGGLSYAPHRDAVARLYAMVVEAKDAKPQTLGGCQVIPTDHGLLICREVRNLPVPMPLMGATSIHWDNRFCLEITGVSNDRHVSLEPLGQEGARNFPRLWADFVPEPVRYSLPALFCDGVPVQTSHTDDERALARAGGLWIQKVQFVPKNPALGGIFPIA